MNAAPLNPAEDVLAGQNSSPVTGSAAPAVSRGPVLFPVLAYDPASGTLSILANARGAAVHVGSTAADAIAVTVDGRLHSSDAAAVSYDPALAGANPATLRAIGLTGGGLLDAITLDNLTDGGDLVVETDGGVTLRGDVIVAGRLTITAATLTLDGATHAAAVSLTSAGLLNLNAGAELAASVGGNGGSIAASADDFVNVGQIRADGVQGASIVISARDYLNAGTLSAAGTAGTGGTVQVGFTHSYIDTAAALTTARGTAAGGTVAVNGGSDGRLFSSGTFAATGTSGGHIDLLGQNIYLVAATADASGTTAGGRVRVGGDYQGSNNAVLNAQNVKVTGATILRANGDNGRAIVWSEADTDFQGSISARGAESGGFIEVSSHGQLTYGGQADAGTGGSLLLDPKNLIVSAAPTGVFPQFQLIDPQPDALPFENEYFGNSVQALSTGNVVVTDLGITRNAAIYLYDGHTGALISALIASPSDQLGSSGATPLTNGNFVVFSRSWNGEEAWGAVTWGSGTTGVSGVLSSANSLIGVYGDPNRPSSYMYVVPLTNGNYVVDNPYWNGVGAVTWGDGARGTTGVVSPSISLVGENGDTGDIVGTGDNVGSGDYGSGSGILALTNGNYVVLSPNWNGRRGAATWGDGTKGITGTISAANSVVGRDPNDQVGYSGIALSNGNYVVDDLNALSGVGGSGAVTWGDGTKGVVGLVSAANSLASDPTEGLYAPRAVALSNGNYVVRSTNGNTAGAVTWGNGLTGTVGLISADNSLTGDGLRNITSIIPLLGPNSNFYVVLDPEWDSGKGAVTWVDGTKPMVGTVSAANSLVGTAAGDGVGTTVTALTNGNYVIASPNWNGGLGAATWADGSQRMTGTVSATNSLVGTVHQFSTALDHVGDIGVTALANGNYVVLSQQWNGRRGAATWGDGTHATTGTVTAANSLVGTTGGDRVGNAGAVALTNGNYVVRSSLQGQGAATWQSGSGPPGEVVTESNSLITDAGGPDQDFSITPLPDGSYVVVAVRGGVGSGDSATWVDGRNGITLDARNTITSQNSLVGPGGGAGAEAFQTGGTFLFFQFLPNSNHEVIIAAYDAGQLTFVLGQSQTMTVTPDFLTRTLNAGTNITLQASQDITINSPITEAPIGTAGSFTLQAGRSILLNASINTAGGNLTLIANDTLADGVVDGARDAGSAGITMAAGVTLNTGAGKLSIDIKHSTDKTHNDSGTATLLGVTTAAATLSSASTLGITLNGINPGDGIAAGTYTQVNVTGSINLNGAALQLTVSAAAPPGSTFLIVTSSGGVLGTFDGLPEGTVFPVNGLAFQISYVGRGGHDVVLTRVGSALTATVTLTASALAVPLGQPVTFTATVSSTSAGSETPTGTLVFAEGQTELLTTTLSNGQATFTTTALSPGSHVLTATYAGDSTFLGATSAPVTISVEQPPTPIAGVLAFSAGSLTVDEGNTATLMVTRVNGSAGTVSILYAVSVPSTLALKNRATPGSDFQGDLSGTLTFLDGETARTIAFPLVADNLVEVTESFTVTLQSATGGAVVGTLSTVAVGILDGNLPDVPLEMPKSATLQLAGSGFGKSEEHYIDFATKAYARFLSRVPEAEGLHYWVSLMMLYESSHHAQGLRQEQIEAGFLNSDEYKGRYGGIGEAWLRGIYRDLLDREAEPAGLQYWLERLTANVAPTDVALGFTTSDERLRNRVTDTYFTLLERAPEPEGLSYWMAIFKAGGTTEDINSGFVGSAEYYAKSGGAASNPARWVREAYLDILFRAPRVDEMSYWLGFLKL